MPLAHHLTNAGYDKGDAEVEVEWFERDVSGGEERRIFKRRPGSEVYTFNSTQLRAIRIEMQLQQPVGGVPLQEVRPSRAHAQAAMKRIRNILFCKTQQCATPPAQLWEITPGSERLILDKCCC